MTAAVPGESSSRTTPAPCGPGRLRGQKILYVDDDPLLRRLVSAVLRNAGAICLAAATHDQAVRLAGSESEIAAAILDFQMPDGNVGRLVERLRSVRPVLPLIGTSGADRREEFLELGVARFLGKPWGADDLLRAVS